MKATIYSLKTKPIEIKVPDSVLTKSQVKNETRIFGDTKYVLKLRYDDSCGNGHNSFSATVSIYEKGREAGGGAAHDIIAEVFPEYADVLKYHLMSSHGPMHYLANSLYLASDRDYNGKKKGEPTQFKRRILFIDKSGNPFPITFDVKSDLLAFIQANPSLPELEILEVPYVEKDKKETYKFSPKFTFKGMPEVWYKCPFDTRAEAEEFKQALETYKLEILTIPVAFSEGKQPELEAARRSAVWPEANLEDFTEENLLARLPALLEEFKAAMEKLGFVY